MLVAEAQEARLHHVAGSDLLAVEGLEVDGGLRRDTPFHLDDAPGPGHRQLCGLEQLVVGVEDVGFADLFANAGPGEHLLELIFDARDHEPDTAPAEQLPEVVEHRHCRAAYRA